MSSAPNALAALIAYQDQYGPGAMPAPGQPIASSAIWSGDSFTFPTGTPIVNTTLTPAPNAANIPFNPGVPPAPPPVVVSPVPQTPAPAVLLTPAPAAPAAPVTPAPPPVTVVSPVPQTPAPAVLLTPAPATPPLYAPDPAPIIPVPSPPNQPLNESQWITAFSPFSTDTSPTTSCGANLQYTGASGRIFCAQPDASGNPALPLAYWEDVYAAKYGQILTTAQYLQLQSSFSVSDNTPISLPNLLAGFAAVGYGPASPVVVNPVPTAATPLPPAPPVVVNPVPTPLTPSATGTPAAGTSNGSIISGIPNEVLFIGAGAVVLLFVLMEK